MRIRFRIQIPNTGGYSGRKKTGRGGQQASHTVSHSEQARMESCLGFGHFAYWAKANEV
jgi:hypothetical protein